jgi:ABC-type uncharacterized transport system permease subunit
MVLAASDVPAAPVLAVMAFGVLLAIAGHLYGSKSVVATGLAILFLATAAMVVGGYVAYQGEETDPRPSEEPSSPDF